MGSGTGPVASRFYATLNPMPYVLRPPSVRRFRRAPLHRALAVILACLQVGFGLAAGPRAAAADQAPPDVPPFKINRGDFGEGLEVALLVSHELGIEDDEAALARLYDIGSKIALAADDPSTVTT